MYHYVRPIKGSRYPRIKGLELNSFKKQLDYLSKRYNFITAEQLIAYFLKKEKLPKKPCYLTFDDGFKDHVKYVMPELRLRKIQGSFFPPAQAIEKKKLLDVHAIHFILASTNKYRKLANEVDSLCLKMGFSKKDIEKFRNNWALPGRFDGAEIMYIKSMLQHVLTKNNRSKLVSYLFKKYVGKNTKKFSEELYMSVSDTKKLVKNGMYVGSHGYKHHWLNREKKSEQLKDIKLSLKFLRKIGINNKNWIMCYPYGGFNKDTLEILKSNKCIIGLTTKVGMAYLDQSKALELSRFDTNDFTQR